MLKKLEVAFYRTMLWFIDYGLTIARSTGRNPSGVAALSVDSANISGHIQRLELNS